MKIDIRRLREPPPSRQLRKLDLTFVDALASKMTEDPFGSGIPPMAVVCTSVKSVEEFKMDFDCITLTRFTEGATVMLLD